jgi:hypothetical protein
MPIDSMLVSAAVILMFLVFAGVLGWGDLQSRAVAQMARDKRAKKRVSFNRSFDSMIVGGDGTWSIKSRLEDISASGTRTHLLGLTILR